MPYTNVGEIADDLASFADETDVASYTVSPSRRRRLGHYIQRAHDDMWNYRPWSFKYLTVGPFQTNVHEYNLPTNFGNVGDNGVLWNEADNSKEPWAEIAIQDMMALIAAGRDFHKRWFSIGYSSGLQAVLYVAKPDSNYGQFKLFYEKAPATFDLNNLGAEAVPFPPIFHDALFAGSLANLQQAKGDPMSIWRAEYIAKLSKATSVFMPNSSRMQQLPNTVGGQW